MDRHLATPNGQTNIACSHARTATRRRAESDEAAVRRMIAVLLAPLATGIVYALIFAVLAVFQTEAFSQGALLATAIDIALWAGVAAVVAFAMTVLVGLPLAISLEKRGRDDLRDMVLLGAMLGALPFVVFDVYVVVGELGRHTTLSAASGVFNDLPRALALAALGVSCGAASGWTYWSIVQWR